MNLKFNSNYRRYAKEIPIFLRNRPHSMVKHCMERFEAAKSIPRNSVRIKENGEFLVKSCNPMALEPYRLRFGDEEKMPHCNCHDWSKSAYPCKHFFAVFQYYPAWSWEAFPSFYRNSVFLNLDEAFDIPIVQIIADQGELNNADNSLEQLESNLDDNEIESLSCDNSSDIYNVTNENEELCVAKDNDKDINIDNSVINRKKGTTIRDFLADIRRLSFLVEGKPEVLEELQTDLSAIRDKLYTCLPKEKGILLRPKTFEDYGKKQQNLKLKKLRLRKRKCPFTGRVGERKEKFLKSSKLQISAEDLNENVNVENGEIIVHCEGKTGLKEYKDSIGECNRVVISSDDDQQESNEQNSILSRIDLSKKDLKSIGDFEMLNDTVIHVFQGMMKKQYPETAGLQDPLLGSNLGFSVCSNKPFVQILHDGRLHWIAISTYNCQPGEVCYMDSLFRGRITDKVKQQICSLLHSQNDVLKIKALPVQQQTNGVDCGVYAIAFISYLVFNKKYPVEVTFDQKVMRHHLIRALAADRLSQFPIAEKQGKMCNQKEFELQLHCSCRMSWVPSDNRTFGR